MLRNFNFNETVDVNLFGVLPLMPEVVAHFA